MSWQKSRVHLTFSKYGGHKRVGGAADLIFSLQRFCVLFLNRDSDLLYTLSDGRLFQTGTYRTSKRKNSYRSQLETLYARKASMGPKTPKNNEPK